MNSDKSWHFIFIDFLLRITLLWTLLCWTALQTLSLEFRINLFEARNIIIVIFSSLNYFYSYLNLHTKKVFSLFFQHSFLQYFPSLNLSQKSCFSSFAFPHWNFKIWCPPPFFLLFPPFIYNIEVFLHPKFSTYIQLVCTNWRLTRWNTHKLLIICPLS